MRARLPASERTSQRIEQLMNALEEKEESADYIHMGIPNWAAKFFIDALLAKRHVLARLPDRALASWRPPDDLPRTLPQSRSRPQGRPRVAMYTADGLPRVAQMPGAWSSWGFRPDWIIVEEPQERPAVMRIADRIRDEGLGWVMGKLRPSSKSDAEPQNGPPLLWRASARARASR